LECQDEGKSTLLKAITGLLERISGEVLVNGKSVFLDFESWRSEISVIPQDCCLFNRTIYQNITFSYASSQEQHVHSATETALVMQFSSKLKDGLQSVIETGGKNLSGGQRQRVHIARALLKQSKYLNFDEPVSIDLFSLIFVTSAADKCAG
jgi:ABC-type multidrug transport system fused ATPase/permease subunit